MSQQLILKQQQQLTISGILRTYGKRFTQVHGTYSDGQNGRCALGVLMSYYGWDGKDKFSTYKILMSAFNALRSAGIDRNLLIEMNDSGFTFDEIAGYIDRINK